VKPTYEELEAAIREYVEAHDAMKTSMDRAAWTTEENMAAHRRRLEAITALHELAPRLAPRTMEEAV
jgi:hypothetical protein